MFLLHDLDTGGQQLPSGCEWASAIMAPELIQPQYKRSLASNRRALVTDSPVTGLARVHAKAPLTSSVADSKRVRPVKSKLRKPPSKHHPTATTATSENADMSDGDDKKRNKLGYQRISIACAHCRRRKIRCLVAENDPHNRCQNCIRLKKDCLFYPVDQQSAMESRPESKSKHNHASSQNSSVMTSSPQQRSISGRIDQGSHSYDAYSNLSDTSSGYPGIPISPGPYSQPSYSMPQPQAPPTPWSLADEYSPQGQAIPAASNGLSSNYPAYGALPISTDYPPFAGPLESEPGTMQRTASLAYASDSDRSNWSQHQPARSMSYPDYPNENIYAARYMSDAQQPGVYQSQPPSLQMPMHSTSMNPYSQPSYVIAHDQVNGSLSGLPMHQAFPEQGPWLQSGPPRREDRTRPLMTPQ